MAGPNQKEGAVKPLPALSESNYARTGTDTGAPSGDVGQVGYTKKPYPPAGPALASTDVRNTISSIGSLGNDGTARGSYDITPQIVDAEDPLPGNAGTGNGGAR